jgi:type II secretory pathway pseudopilin PulG
MATGSFILVRSRSSQRGFTYLGLIFLVVAIGIGLAKAGTIWQTEVQREKEKELLFVGEQFRQAIGSYYESTPAEVKQYPPVLEDLLHDPRFPEMRRHLRKLYYDPVMGSEEWGLVKDQGRIVGVYSKSETQPLMKVFKGEGRQGFSKATTYAGWIFSYKSNGATTILTTSQIDGGYSAPISPVQSGNAISEGRDTSGVSPDQNITASDVDPGRKQDCLAQSRTDAVACSSYCKGEGPVAECSLCRASLTSRYNACLKGYSLPPLAK